MTFKSSFSSKTNCRKTSNQILHNILSIQRPYFVHVWNSLPSFSLHRLTKLMTSYNYNQPQRANGTTSFKMATLHRKRSIQVLFLLYQITKLPYLFIFPHTYRCCVLFSRISRYVSNRNVVISLILSAITIWNFLGLLDGNDTAVFTKLLPIALCILLYCVHVPSWSL